MQNFKKTNWLLFALFFTYFTDLNGQKSDFIKGYYFSNSNDSIAGFFDKTEINSGQFSFYTTTANKDKTVLTTDKVKKIVISDSISYLSQEISQNDVKEKIFIRQLVYGTIQLFVGFTQSDGAIFFTNIPEKNEIRRINKNNPNGFLQFLFPDCKHLLNKKIAYTEGGLSNAILAINYCLNPAKRAIKTQKSGFSMALGAHIGSAYFDMKDASWWFPVNTKATPYTNLSGGLDVRFDISKRLSVNVSTSLSRRKTQFDSVYLTGTYIYINTAQNQVIYYPIESYSTIEMRRTTLETPVEVVYRFYKANRKLIPYLSVGASLLKNKNIEMVRDIIAPNKLSSFTSYTTLPPNAILPNADFWKTRTVEPLTVAQHAFMSSVGLQYLFTPKTTLNLGFRYAYDYQTFILGNSDKFIFGKSSRYEMSLTWLYKLSF